MTARDWMADLVRGLRAQGLRAVLSSAGIVAGVGAVVTALAIGEGARREALAEIGALGVENVRVRAVGPEIGDGETPRAPALTLADRDAIAATLPGIRAVAAIRSTRVAMSTPLADVTAVLAGVTPDWRAVTDMAIARGRWFDEDDERARRRVAVAGAALAARLFGATDAVGMRVHAAGSWYQVVGVLGGADAPRSALTRVDPADTLFTPFGAMDVPLGAGDAPDRAEEIVVRAGSAEAVEAVRRGTERALQARHGSVTPWEVVLPRALLEARLRAQHTFNVVVLAIGLLALAISGVGIMNVMLASVSERVAEIGVRRAVGATRAAILWQFSMESALLTLAGGACGVGAGALMSAAVALAAGWPTAISPGAVGLALLLAVATGVGFGSYPAARAARLDPATALRAE
ncbi:MAG: ABC transporter permease [Vicinamibacteria bacterium]